MVSIIFLSLLISTTAAQLTVSRNYSYLPKCNFDAKKFSGRWYHISRTANPFEPLTICTSIEVSNHNSTMNVELTGLNTITGYENRWGALFTPRGQKSVADYVFQLPPRAINGFGKAVILETDYDHFCVVLMIQNDNDYFRPTVANAWIASRDRNLSQKHYKYAMKALQKNNIPVEKLRFVKQDDCSSL